MEQNCALDFSSIDPSCFAFNKPGGVFPFLYVARLSELKLSRATDGTVTKVEMRNGAALRKFISRKFQNSGSYPLKSNDNGRKQFTHTVVERIYHETQDDRNTLTGLAQQEDLVFFLPTNAKQMEVYGLNLGLSATAGAGGTGTKLDDDSTYLYTFTGDESEVPPLMIVPPVAPAVADINDAIAMLDALVAA